MVDEFGGPEQLAVVDVPIPDPAPGEVAIAVDYAGVGFVDVLFRRGDFSTLLSPRFTPGIEVSGRVQSVGADVDLPHGLPVVALLNDFSRGGRAGGYAEVALARADLVIPLNERLQPEAAAGLLVNATTAQWALQRSATIKRGDDVAVLGASGGLGAVALRLAAAAGARRVIAVLGRPEAEPAARQAGATDIVLRGTLDDALRNLTDGRGVDVVLDPVGGHARAQVLEQVAFGGRHIVVGNASGSDLSISTDQLWHTSLTVGGFSLGAAAAQLPETVAEEALAALELLAADGRQNSVEVVELNDVIEVHRALDAGRAPTKTVLQINPVPRPS
ncbi:quinone oxidoreductase family protein [Pseudonocardia alni]|uniref:quinone oxidoreductase family protein n=1 Tax=Pseudonocardia alni TaxID=33907 RepID=UPI00280BF1FE|nr:zinc-binding dehydrogenase [Pseudonocardia alni]